MYRSRDGKITVDVVKTSGDAVFPAADFSILNIPVNPGDAKSMFFNLFNSPAQRHMTLILDRHPRKSKLEAIGNLKEATQHGFSYLDTVHLWYERANTSSNIGLLPVAEGGHIFYKGDIPNVKNTSWFSPDNPNATNHWGLSPAEYEGRAATYHKKFAWEIGLLLYTMSEPVEHKRMIYGLDDDHEHVLKFAKVYGIQVHFLATSDAVAKQILSRYEVT